MLSAMPQPVKALGMRVLYLRSWGKVPHLATRPRSTWAFLLRSRETANFTYALANEGELPAFVAQATGLPVRDLREYLQELAADEALHGWRCAKLDRRDRTGRALVGRRAGRYMFVRGLKPQVVLETGADVGMGSAVLSRALQR